MALIHAMLLPASITILLHQCGYGLVQLLNVMNFAKGARNHASCWSLHTALRLTLTHTLCIDLAY